MITLAPEFALALVVALFGAAGSFFAIKIGGQETQRLVKALHGRFDHLEAEVSGIKIQQARQDERIKSIKESQRFKMRGPMKSEVVRVAEQDMFVVEDEE